MAEEMGADFPQRAARLECGMLLLWLSLFLDIGSEEEGAWE